MKCKKCGSDSEDGSKFCTKCGEKFSTGTSKKGLVSEKKFESPTIDQIKLHLEFLGYSNEFNTNDAQKVVLINRHPNKPNIICSSSVDGIVFLSSTWNGLKEINNIEQYKCLNKLTSNNTFAQIVIDNDGNLVLYSTFLGEYDKKRFGEFFDIFLADINKVLSDETFKELFTK